MAGFIRGEHYNVTTDIPDLSGRTFLVTGGSQGIGLGIVSHILQHNPEKLFFMSRKAEHAEEAKQHLKEYGDISKLHWVECNLSDLHEVQTVSNKLRDEAPDIDVIVLDAGIGVGKYELSHDGYDTHFQVNVLSQFLLLNTLLPNLKKRAERTDDARVVMQSSSLHDTAVSDVKFASIDEINTDIGATRLYDRTKLAMILFAFKLDRELKAKGINNIFVNATHPGLVGTDQQSQAVDAYGSWLGVINKVMRPIMKDPIDEGCRPALFAATDPDIVQKGIRGRYIIPDKKVTDPSKQAQDETLANRHWKLCNDMLQKTLGISF